MAWHTHYTAYPHVMSYLTTGIFHMFFLQYHYTQFTTSSQNIHIYVSLEVPTC